MSWNEAIEESTRSRPEFARVVTKRAPLAPLLGHAGHVAQGHGLEVLDDPSVGDRSVQPAHQLRAHVANRVVQGSALCIAVRKVALQIDKQGFAVALAQLQSRPRAQVWDIGHEFIAAQGPAGFADVDRQPPCQPIEPERISEQRLERHRGA